jgi:hypothetical protein
MLQGKFELIMERNVDNGGWMFGGWELSTRKSFDKTRVPRRLEARTPAKLLQARLRQYWASRINPPPFSVPNPKKVSIPATRSILINFCHVDLPRLYQALSADPHRRV